MSARANSTDGDVGSGECKTRRSWHKLERPFCCCFHGKVGGDRGPQETMPSPKMKATPKVQHPETHVFAVRTVSVTERGFSLGTAHRTLLSCPLDSLRGC